MSMMTEELKHLPFSERLQLATDLWDSVVADSLNVIPLSSEQIQEIDYRLDLLETDPTSGTLWPAVRNRILATW